MSHVTDLAHALIDARARPEGVALPEELGLTDAYRVQADAFAQRAQALAGWKIGVRQAKLFRQGDALWPGARIGERVRKIGDVAHQ